MSKFPGKNLKLSTAEYKLLSQILLTMYVLEM